ncbi:MAG: EamA family transporter [Solirubrobacteraceae bacterium]
MVAIALALASSVCFGVCDFIGGLQTRKMALLGVLVISQLVAFVLLVVILSLSGDSPPPLVKLLPAMAAGIGGMIALSAFFRALAIGTMSIVAPISSTGVAVPVLVGVASGNRPGVLQVIGIVVAVAGVIAASREPHDDGVRPAGAGIALALGAAIGFGGYQVGIRASAQSSVLWTLGAARLSAVLVLLAVLAVKRTRLLPEERSLAPLASLVLLGVLDLFGNVLYAIATRHGELAIVAVLASLYPVSTVVLARAVLAERIQRIQEVGIVTALLGVLLIAAG